LLNATDKFLAGFANVLTFGYSNKIRVAIYGEVARRNQQGRIYNAGEFAGIVASVFASFGAPVRLGGVSLAERILQIYSVGSAGAGSFESTTRIIKGCATPLDFVPFLPLVGSVRGVRRTPPRNGASTSRTNPNPVRNTSPRRNRVSSPKPACFVAGTEILTPEGEELIENIQVGDWVIADDPTTPGEIEARRVVQTFVREVSEVVDLYVDGEVITTTDEHPFWVPGTGWVEAEDLQVGSLLQTDEETFVDIDRIERREGKTTVYNFEVEGFHTYFVSDLDVLVHNNCVDTRINIANDRTASTPLRPATGTQVSAGFNHVLQQHFNVQPAKSRSVFTISPDDLKKILQSKQVVSSPVKAIGGGQFVRIVNVNQVVGITALKHGGNPTSTIQVFTDIKGNLITTYPVP
jgi:hypothetical protein